MRQHRYDQIGEIDAVAALARFLVQRAAGADIIAHVRNRDDCLISARIALVLVGRGPDRIVMVARIDRVNRHDRQVTQILALVLMQRQGRDDQRIILHPVAKDVGNAMFVNGDQAEAARRKGIAQYIRHPRGHARRPAMRLGQHQVAGTRIARIADRRVLANTLVDRTQPQLAVGHFLDHAQQFLARFRKLFHRMRDPAATRFLGPSQNPVANGQCGLPCFGLAPLDDAQSGRGLAFRFPFFRSCDQCRVVHIDDAQHRHLGHTPHLVKGAGRTNVDQPFIGHVPEQRLERNLFLPLEAERLGDLPLARRRIGFGDEIHHLLTRGQAGRTDLGGFLLFLVGSHLPAIGMPAPARQCRTSTRRTLADVLLLF